MNRKQLTLLIVLGVVLGGLGYWAYNKRQSSYESGAASEEGQKVLHGVAANAINDVAQLYVRQASNEVTLVRGADGWSVKERGGYPANFGNISDTVKKFWDLKVTRPVEVGPSRLPALKLTKNDGTFVEMKSDKGQSIAALTLGLQTTREARDESPLGGGGSFPSGRYVMRGEDIKTVALVSDPLNVDARPEEWLNKDWFKVEKPKSVSVTTTNATNNWKLTRESESADWKLADVKPGENVDSGKASGLNYLLSSPSFNDVVIDPKPEQTGLAKPVEAEIVTFDGLTYRLKLGKPASDEENFIVQISVNATIPSERTPGKDEKPEDKEKLDKEFAEKRKKLEEKVKAEKGFEKWTYTVAKWTVDNLLKERKDFLAEKKDEKTDEAKPGDAPKLPTLP